jgi:hypothetical protein
MIRCPDNRLTQFCDVRPFVTQAYVRLTQIELFDELLNQAGMLTTIDKVIRDFSPFQFLHERRHFNELRLRSDKDMNHTRLPVHSGISESPCPSGPGSVPRFLQNSLLGEGADFHILC